MNIFFLDKSPELAAKYLCDKHVPKMLLESSQMLSTAIQRHLGGTIGELYKPAYPKHPMTIWVGDNKNNFKWALKNASSINKQYEVRFNKKHKSNRVIEFIKYWDFSDNIPQGDMTNPPQCMPDNYKNKSHVIAYRTYYKGDKAYFAKWEKGVATPTWWLQ
tara:strand:+ start:4979 stop:5461 length:483 start_codon:yes stop_codon:yes gene_type:complete